MKKKLIVIVLIVLAVGGGAAYTLTRSNKSSDSNTSSSSNSDNQFTASPTDSAFKATITTQTDSGQTVMVMEHDQAKNITKVTGSAGGSSFTYYYAPSGFYMCQTESSCMKYSSESSFADVFDPTTYTYDETKLAALRTGSSYQGVKNCPAGSCNVWKVTSNNSSLLMYIDTKTHRISEVDSTYGTTTSKIEYDFNPVSLTLPENATTVTIPQ